MNTIRVKFVDLAESGEENCWGKYDDVNTNRHFIREALKKMYILDEESDPDYVFTHVPVGGASGYEYGKYRDAVIIFVQYENVFPDFYCYDYAVGADFDLKYGNRYFYIDAMLANDITRSAYNKLLIKHLNIIPKLAEREFCGMTVSNIYGAAGQREEMFRLLSTYRKVESGGKAFNNVGGPVKDKLEFESRHKFTIAFDNIENGFVQEKIGMAFAAGTVPIYWGNPNVTEIYNEKAFINCHAFHSFEDVLEKVKEVDADDEKYLSMLREPALLNEKKLEKWDEELEDWLRKIIEQPKEYAIKRRNDNWPGIMQEMRLEGFKRLHRRNRKRDVRLKFMSVCYKPLKKMGLGKKAHDWLLDIFYKK